MNDEVENTDALESFEADEVEYGFEPVARVTGASGDKSHGKSRGTSQGGARDATGGKSADAVIDNLVDAVAHPRQRLSSRRPSTSGTGPAASSRPRGRSGLRRRLSATAVLLGALGVMGVSYASFATSSGAVDSGNSASDIAAGRQLYSTSCITCHGANLSGVDGNGPSLIGVGSASVYFQVSTGRMPLAQNGAYAQPHGIAKYSEAQIQQLGEYIESVGGGPSIPHGSLESGSSQYGEGGELFRLNCASCHGATGKGAPLSGGASAPSLNSASNKEIYAAMLSGPENMPVFADNQLTPAQKRMVIGYIQTLKDSADPGGNGIDRIGPVSEAIVIWVAGVGAVMIAILWIGARAR